MICVYSSCGGYDGGLGTIKVTMASLGTPPSFLLHSLNSLTFTPFVEQNSQSWGRMVFSQCPFIVLLVPPPLFLLVFVRNVVGTAVQRRRRAIHSYPQKCGGDKGGGGVWLTKNTHFSHTGLRSQLQPCQWSQYNGPHWKIIPAPWGLVLLLYSSHLNC